MANPSVWVGLWPSARDARLLAVHRGVARDRLHLTLAFIPCTEDLRDVIFEATRRVAERMAAAHPPIADKLGAVRVFPGPDPVHYIGVRDADNVILELHRELDYGLAAEHIGIDRTHTFLPHITLRIGEAPVRHHRQRNITFESLRVVAGDAVITLPFTGLPARR